MSSLLNEGSRWREKEKALKFLQFPPLKITLNSLNSVMTVQ